MHRPEDLGVTDLIVGLRYVYDWSADSMTLSQKIDALRTYADNVIGKAEGPTAGGNEVACYAGAMDA